MSDVVGAARPPMPKPKKNALLAGLLALDAAAGNKAPRALAPPSGSIDFRIAHRARNSRERWKREVRRGRVVRHRR